MVMLCLYQVFAVMFEDLGDIGFHAVNFMVDSIEHEAKRDQKAELRIPSDVTDLYCPLY